MGDVAERFLVERYGEMEAERDRLREELEEALSGVSPSESGYTDRKRRTICVKWDMQSGYRFGEETVETLEPLLEMDDDDLLDWASMNKVGEGWSRGTAARETLHYFKFTVAFEEPGSDPVEFVSDGGSCLYEPMVGEGDDFSVGEWFLMEDRERLRGRAIVELKERIREGIGIARKREEDGKKDD
jgi:hypothetical protein